MEELKRKQRKNMINTLHINNFTSSNTYNNNWALNNKFKKKKKKINKYLNCTITIVIICSSIFTGIELF